MGYFGISNKNYKMMATQVYLCAKIFLWTKNLEFSGL